MTKPALLLQSEYTDQLLDGALDDRFEVIRPWLEDDPDAVIEARGRDVIVSLTTHVDAPLLDRLPNLRLIVAPGAGYENIDVATARARGVRVANAGGTHSADVADHALALVLASVHRLREAQDWIRSGCWTGGTRPPVRRAMSAQRFGIVGLGNIGTAIAERLVPFGGEIAWWSRSAKETPWPRKRNLMELAEWCTALIVATRGDAAGLIGAETIAAVGSDGLIVNIARGAVVDEDALIAALKGGQLGCAALDVFVNEPTPLGRWRDTPHVIMTPHVAGVSQQSTMRLRDAAIRNVLAVLNDGPLLHEIAP